MVSSLIRVVIFLAAIAGLAALAGALSDRGGEVRLWLFDWEFTLGPLQALIVLGVMILLVWLILRLVGLASALFRFLNGDETAISRYFDRNRERRGYAALSDGMIALAGGEHGLALQKARAAERLLSRPDLTGLLTAQAAEAAGDGRAATEAWKALLSSEQTRFVAVQGLLRQKLTEGDTSTALKLAERAFALKPRHSGTQDILLKLQADSADWKGARGTLSEKLRLGSLPRSVYRRRDALLALQEAKGVLDEGNTVEAREAAISANRMSPDLVPAAAIAARALTEKGDARSAARVLRKAWEAQPHPDLAAAFAAIVPDESPDARLKRFKTLLAIRPEDEETRLTQAELLLSAEDFVQARKVLGDLADTHPTQRTLAILAAVERGSGSADAVVRGILARALSASRGPQWCCDKCNATQADWHPICPDCGGFDTLSWREPASAMRARSPMAQGLEPLILGAPADEAVLADDPEAEARDSAQAEGTDAPDTILRRGT